MTEKVRAKGEDDEVDDGRYQDRKDECQPMSTTRCDEAMRFSQLDLDRRRWLSRTAVDENGRFAAQKKIRWLQL